MKLRQPPHPFHGTAGLGRSLAACSILLAAPAAASPVLAQPVAVTVDDVPWVGAVPPDGVAQGTERLLGALTRRQVPAAGFVVCDRMDEGAPIVRAWLEAGMEIGSHSAAHRDLNRGLEPWLDDVRRCDDALAPIIGRNGGYFRFPLLHQGADRATRDEAARRLAELGYRTAHVTIDNSEWVLAAAYGRALARADTDAMRSIGDAYVAHMRDAARHFRDLARDKFGGDIAHVLLVHANALNADHLGAVLDALALDGFEFVSLDAALDDPAYALTDEYVGPRGLSWVYRASPLSREDPWDEAAEAALRERFPD